MVIDKFCYNLQLYRHHERARDAGIQVSRSWLMHLMQTTAMLLELIFDAQLASVLASRLKSHG